MIVTIVRSGFRRSIAGLLRPLDLFPEVTSQRISPIAPDFLPLLAVLSVTVVKHGDQSGANVRPPRGTLEVVIGGQFASTGALDHGPEADLGEFVCEISKDTRGKLLG